MGSLPHDVTAFIDAHISSVMALEVLLHLADNPRDFEPRELSVILGGSPDALALCLDELHRQGLITRSSLHEAIYRYAPTDRAVERAVDATAHAYARRKVAVVARIFQPEVDEPGWSSKADADGMHR